MLAKRPLAELVLLVVAVAVVARISLQLQQDALTYQAAAAPPRPPLLRSPPSTTTNNSNDGISTGQDRTFHFAQISDLHVSRYNKKGGHFHLLDFVTSVLPVVYPELVFVTGDLTDAKDEAKLTSQQFEDEWRAYARTLATATNLTERGDQFWWDLRGNHDCFNLPAWDAPNNHFATLSRAKTSGFAYLLDKGFGTYHFIGLDGCPNRGPSRPFNFFGVYDRDDVDFLESALAAHSRANHTFLLGHYPLSTTLQVPASSGRTLAALTRHVSLYLCGHLHRFKWGVAQVMYAHKPSGMLELELGDVKSHGMFRIVVVDDDVVAFADAAMNAVHIADDDDVNQVDADPTNWPVVPQPPVVVVTYPKDGRYLIPRHEPALSRVLDPARPIRWFAFADTRDPQRDLEWTVELDGRALVGVTPQWISTVHGRHLWTCDWADAAAALAPRVAHHLRLTARDVRTGLSSTTDVRFRTSGDPVAMDGGLGELVIATDLPPVIQATFWAGYVVASGLLLVPKLFVLVLDCVGGPAAYLRWRSAWSRRLVAMDEVSMTRGYDLGRIRQAWHDADFAVRAIWLRFCEVARVRALWYPMAASVAALVALPMLVGHLVFDAPDPSASDATQAATASDSWSARWTLDAFYVYGAWVHDTWHPIADTWVYAMFTIWNVVVPFNGYVSTYVAPHLLYSRHNPRRARPIHLWRSVRAGVAALAVYHVYNLGMMATFYGGVAVVASPLAWIMALYAVTLWRLMTRRIALDPGPVGEHDRVDSAEHDGVEMEDAAKTR
ncbi:hypothetical protein AMAG_05010 [Allomyces macrogynus ATCC 38327]|uniref:Calcineurin-like phosphoesterase domain-containing protein n=1 Tax=Allomyces macrogynus (strain ATCC 38327) TaxID=578462 RepID=A0A0L0S6G8_ALLM3|nr:hypothetical protein AMAG_05010 [Allomyces macrogynus ATCC 38327]|eukprot:KNE58198.1 hypothetical protein AMAG_05010 [Allomyces macrogynus ATCC 38327]